MPVTTIITDQKISETTPTMIKPHREIFARAGDALGPLAVALTVDGFERDGAVPAGGAEFRTDRAVHRAGALQARRRPAGEHRSVAIKLTKASAAVSIAPSLTIVTSRWSVTQ